MHASPHMAAAPIVARRTTHDVSYYTHGFRMTHEVTAMVLPEEGHLLRIYIGESDRHGGALLYEWILQQARHHGLAGATVLRGGRGLRRAQPPPYRPHPPP